MREDTTGEGLSTRKCTRVHAHTHVRVRPGPHGLLPGTLVLQNQAETLQEGRVKPGPRHRAACGCEAFPREEGPVLWGEVRQGDRFPPTASASAKSGPQPSYWQGWGPGGSGLSGRDDPPNP